MKLHYKYLSIVILAAASSCSEILDIDAENTISGNVLTDEASVQKALNGTYYNFSGINDGFDGGELMGGDFILIPELLARISPNGGAQEIRWQSVNAPLAYLDFLNKEILATNDRVAANWRRAYETINQANSILNALDVIADQNVRSRIEGEALAIRGILYYEMILLWGPQYDAPGVDPTTDRAIPIVIDPILDVADIPKLSDNDRNTIEEVYQRAEADLLAASILLEDFGTNGVNLSYYACEAYLSKLYLQKGDFTDARSHADNVLSSNAYTLAGTPMEAFNNAENSSEDIFAIQQTLANNTGDRSAGIGLTTYLSSLVESGLGTYGIFQNMLNSTSFFNSPNFSTQDRRGTVDSNVNETTTGSSLTTAYYQNIANNFGGLLSTAKYTNSGNVLPVVRLAEVYLNHAEAEFFAQGQIITQTAVDDLNAIRARANISTLTIADFGGDSDAFFDSLVLERTREFMHEGMLFEDLKRWGGFIGFDTPSFTFDPWDNRFVLPIPQSETDTWD